MDAPPPTDSTISARRRVRDSLRKQILSGSLKAGTRLTQQQLAKEFGVAQTVVRESLMELQFVGLVRAVEKLGIFVSELSGPQLVQAYEVREMLEGLAARLCCQRASRADIAELRAVANEIQDLGVAGNAAARGARDRHFHRRIIELCGNQVLQRLTEAYQEVGMTVHASRPHDVIHQEHVSIIDAIESNDAVAAEQAARSHVAGARVAIQQQLLRPDFKPTWVAD